jgi:hypothetical protein
MPVRRRTEDEPERPRRPRATTADGRERQLSSLAYDAIEGRIQRGEASAQELIYFAKAGSRRERLERQKIKHENELLRAKSEQLASMARQEELFAEAISAFSRYSGREPAPDA